MNQTVLFKPQEAMSCEPELPQFAVSSYRKCNSSTDAAMSDEIKALMNAVPGALVVLDTQGRVAEINQDAVQLLGKESRGRLWRDVVNQVFLPDLDQGELRTADGQHFSLSTRPLGYAPGQILLLSDVTRTRQLQRAAQQNLHLITMGKMIASLAHQIRTPLSSSMLYLSQLAESEELDSQKAKKFSSKALDRIRHIESMINDMLVFAHGGQFKMSEIDLATLFDELHQQLQPLLDRRFAKLTVRLESPYVKIHGNPSALMGAFANLCMNALEASKKDPRISVSAVMTQQGQLEIRVKDNGPGMDETVSQHLFDPFFTTKSDGTGLGLAVVKSVIESHQGSIRVESQQDIGSTFIIMLPCQMASRTQLSHTQKAKR